MKNFDEKYVPLSNENRIYYIYMFFLETSEEPFYIGFGHYYKNSKYNRMNTTHRGQKSFNIKPNEYNKLIIREDLTKKEAEELEVDLIKYYGRKDIDENGILINRLLYNGNCLGIKRSKESIELSSSKRRKYPIELKDYYYKIKKKECGIKYREKNKENIKIKRKVYDKTYKEKNPEKCKEQERKQNKQYWEKNKEKLKKSTNEKRKQKLIELKKDPIKYEEYLKKERLIYEKNKEKILEQKRLYRLKRKLDQ